MANSQKFTLTFDAQLNVGQMKGALNQIQSTLNGLKLPQNITKGLQGTIDSLSKEIQGFEVALGKDITSKSDFNKLATQASKITNTFEKLKLQVRDLGNLSDADLEKLFPQSVTQNITKATAAIKQYNQQLKQLKSDVNTAQATVDKLNTKLEDTRNKKPMTDEAWKQLKNSIGQAESEVDKYKNAIVEAQAKAAEVEGRTNNYKQSSIWRQAQKDIETYKNKLAEAETALKPLIEKRANGITFTKQTQEIETLNSKLIEAQQKLDAAKQSLDKFESVGNGGGLQQLATFIGQLTGTDLSNFNGNLQDLGQIIKNYVTQSVEEAAGKINQLKGSISSADPSIKQFSQGMQDSATAVQAFDDQAREISALKTRIQYFFGLNNAINLVKRAIRGAFDTIKELDKAMTETAVVTNFSVSDMWEQLPEYTKRANELGVTTLSAYEAATLYYQQGLKTNEVNALSVETLKMARIAGLDAAEATDRMTNALRGFNMELTEANAQRVDDVYSELAANTASNVDEISTAMTKVASLAHNANMEFETTAAFLAQIIETTRESAETAGTALKTVVARFSEVKKLVDEGTLRGTDEEGQIIDVNKVGAALRTAGIDLNKYFLGEVGLDDIFMELASKWDQLTTIQQRYIATQAAGSRQQSRFIALMSDYARTQELVGKAYNANGAAARQFAKTQESLESKLNRLKNAWNEFLMGLTNNVVVKTFVDLLTDLLNVINKVTSAFGNGAGSVLKWGAAVAGILGGKALFKSGGGLDTLLSTVVNGTGIGNALFKSGILSGKLTNGTVVQGSVAERQSGLGQHQKIFFGQNSLLNNWKDKIQGFKENNVDSRALDAFDALSPAEKIRMASTTGIPTVKTPKTLFGALGNKFVNTGIGGKLSTSLGAALGKIGIGSGAALSGAATLAATLGAVTAAAALAGITIKKLYDLSPAGQVKIAEKYASTLSTIAEGAKKASENYKSVIDKTKQYDQALSQASSKEERSKTIEDRNDYIMQLLEQDKTYAQYLSSTFENGELVLTLDEEALANAAKLAAEVAVKANINSQFANAQLAGRNVNLYRSKLAGVNLKNQTIFEGNNSETGESYYRKLSNEEIIKYTQYQKLIDENTKAMQQYAENAFAQMIPKDQVSDDVANLMAEALSKGFEDTELPTGNGWWRSRGHWQNEYLKYYGTEADSGMKTADIYRAVQQAIQTENKTGSVNQLTGLLGGAGGEGFAKALSMYLGREDFSNINLTLSNVGDLSLLSDDVDLTQLAEAIGIVGDELGTADQKLKEIIKQNIQNQKEQQQKFNTRTAQKVISIGNNLGWDQNETASAIADILALQSFEEQKAIGDLLRSITNDQIAGTILQNLDDSGLREWISNLDFSNPINGLLQLQEAAKTGTDQIQILGKELQQESKFSASSLLSYFTTSSDYESLTEDLQKFREENGKISSTNILELAESNKTLNDLLKTGAISAKALSVALNGIESNEIQVWDLNDAIIAALNSMDDLDSVAKRTVDDLNNFNPGYDENDVTSFINKTIENATENIEKGAWGNNQMRNYMEYIFGEYTGDPGEQYQNWIASGLTWLQNNKDNMKSAWMDIAGSSVESAAVYGDGVKIWEENGEILIDAAGHTTDELVKILTEGTQLTEQQIRMMVTDYKNYSDDFALLLERADTEKAVNEWASKITERGYYLDTELETLAKLLGKDVTEIQKVLGEDFETNYKVAWGEDLTTNIDNVLKKLNKDYKISRAEAWNVPENVQKNQGNASYGYYNEELINFNQLKQSMAEADLSGYFEQTLNEMTKDSNTFLADFGNGLEEVKIQAGETAMEAYTRATEESARQALATAIGDAVVEALKNEHNIEIGADTDLATEKVNTLFDIIDNYVNSNHDIIINGNTDSASTAINNLASAYKNLADGIKAVQNAGSGGGASTQGSGAKGGIVGSYGSGSYRVSPGPALTGEEGPEIVWNKEQGYAYITGQDHPEFQNLQPGDRIFDAKETKKILSLSKGGFVHSYDDPSHGYIPKKELGYTGTSDEKYKKESTWRNELDWLYDLMEDIAELERRQEIIQSRYDIYLKDVTKTGRDLYNLTKAELTNLQTQLQGQQTAQIKRLQQMGELMQQYPQYKDYVKWNDKDKTLEINWDKIEGIQDKDTYDAVTDLVSRAETIQDQMDDAEKSIWDIRKQIQDLQNRYLQQYLDFQNRVLEAVVQQYQDTIDNLSELNDTLNDTNRSILESIQREIDLERQIRDNTNTENQIAEMEARLAYLQRDTTGANASEIRALQKQLDEARENYNDTLVDQAVERLSQANDDAAVQREKQIELMQAQLDYWKESGGLWNEVISLIAEGFTSDGTLIQGSRLEEVLKNAEGYEAMSQAQRDNWANELILETNEVGAHLIQLNEGLKISTETIRAILLRLEGKMGGTPEHSYTAEKTEEKYATGGLNTYTGWAHLDGTPSEPEYVLNARQTDAFLRLADILPAAMNGTAPLTNNYGGNIYLDLNMHVDEIANDYDVDRIADRVKEIIYDAGSYRNVNTLNFIR